MKTKMIAQLPGELGPDTAVVSQVSGVPDLTLRSDVGPAPPDMIENTTSGRLLRRGSDGEVEVMLEGVAVRERRRAVDR